MKKTIKRLELAKTGQHGADGSILSLEDLREAKETFEGSVPVTIGHQMARKDWFPQFGQILTVDLAEDEDAVLIGDVEFNELAAEAYEEGLYTGWSISLPKRPADGKRYIHHLALLGAMPPKIKGLDILKEMGMVSVDFSETEVSDEFFFTKTDLNPAGPDNDTQIQEENVDELEEAQKEIDELKSKNAGLQTQLEEKDKEFSDKVQKLEANEKARKKEELKEAAAGKVPAGKMDELLNFADHVADTGSFEFADGEKTIQRPALDVLVDVFKSINSPGIDKELDFSDATPNAEKEDLSGLMGQV